MQVSPIPGLGKPPSMAGRTTGPQGAGAIFHDFCDETTAHAFFQIGDSKRHWWARFMWLIILIGACGVFGLQFASLVEKYCGFPRMVNTDVESAASMPFPTISVCNVNPYQYSNIPNSTILHKYLRLASALLDKPDQCKMTAICETETDNITQTLCRMMSKAYTKCGSGSQPGSSTGSPQGAVPSPIEKGILVGLDGQLSVIRAETVGVMAVGTLGLLEPHLLFGKATQPVSDLVQDCMFNLDRCTMTNDSGWPHPWYGVCYSFNQDGIAESVRPGPLYGLMMQLHVNRREFLRTTYLSGVRVAVNEPGDMPFPETEGIFVPTGASAAIGISVVETKRLGPPYSQCVKQTDDPNRRGYYWYGSNYTILGCQNTCVQRETVKKCKCWHFAYPKPPDNDTFQFTNDLGPNCTNPDPKKECIPICSFDQVVFCGKNIEMNTKIDCTCPPICTARKYMTTVAHSVWPANGMPGCPLGATNCNLNNTDVYAAENQMKLMVYFESMTIFTYTEEASYTPLSLISDFGGQLGLWIGASFCTIVELISLVISLMIGCCGRQHSIEKQGKDSKDDLNATGAMNWQMKRVQPKLEYQPPPRVIF